METLLDPSVDFTARDTLACTGAGWTHNDIAALADLKRQAGFRFVPFCDDIVPEMFPQYYKAADVKAHSDYCHRALAAADLVVCNSRRVEADVKAWCAAQGLALAATAVCPLGADMSVPETTAPLPAGLERGRYAALMSTIEPRKGHRASYAFG